MSFAVRFLQDTVAVRKGLVLISKENCDFGFSGKGFEMGQEDSCKETNAEDGLVKFDSFVEEHNGRVSEGGLDDFVDSDKNGGNVISEGVGGVANVEKDVKSEVKDDVDVKRSDVVGVKSGEILNVECGGDKSCEIVDGEGDGVVGVSGFVGKCGIGGTLGIGSDGTKSGEKVSDKSESESEASSESDFEASSESDSEASSESDSEASGESESESSSPSLSESSSEEEEDDDDDDGEMMDKTWEEVSRMVEDMFIQEMLDWSDEVRMFELAELLSMSANKAKVVNRFSFVLLYFLTIICCLYNFPEILKVIHQVDELG